ncbi:MAG: NADPH-dependent glutamate synthase [Candidatus Bathyarchaeia archaeon]
MPRRSPEERVKDFDEVALGFTEEQALREAERCLQCPNPTCVSGCPAQIDVKAFIAYIRKGDFEAAVRKIREKNSLPGVCGRVCPQETQCEAACILNRKGAAVNIGGLERFAADYALTRNLQVADRAEGNGLTVAVIGSGPSGLTVAGDLARLGYDVTVFEALHEYGGVLTYGIPEFRLPKRVVKAEIDSIARMGVRFQKDVIVGKTVTVEELFEEGFKAIFIGTGAGPPLFLNVPGENLNGVYTANEFLTRCNLMKAYLFDIYDTPIYVGGEVIVVGGGNVAVDAARVAMRAGGRRVTILYRRTREEMPARVEEVRNAEEEGVRFMFLTNPVKFTGHNGWVRCVECLKMRLGSPDESGRPRPIPVRGSNFAVNTDTVIIAIGRKPNPTVTQTTPRLKTLESGLIHTDSQGRTSIKEVWAGGDVVTGEATVISAIGAGKTAAESIHNYFTRILKRKGVKR